MEDYDICMFPGRLWGPRRGTPYTAFRQKNKPYCIVNLAEGLAAKQLIPWLQDNRITVLNIAGPRESQCPGIYEKSLAALKAFFAIPSLRYSPT